MKGRMCHLPSAIPFVLLTFSLIGCGAEPAGHPLVAGTAASSASDGHGVHGASIDNHPRVRGMSSRLILMGTADSMSSISDNPSPFRFSDIQKECGIDFVHVSGADLEKHFPTQNGSGVALFDFDGDDWLDVYLASFNPMPSGTPPKGKNRLYRNLGGGKFVDVTDRSGLGFEGYCHGIIAGDLDNDGDPDVFLCNYGSNVLFLNNGDGTFRDVSRSAGIDRPGWSSGGAMFDYDNDGDLDIYVANYGEWEYPRDARRCGGDRVPLFCSPESLRSVRHALYRNDGGARFTDVADAVGLGRTDGHGFAAVAADLNGDGRVDLYVTNDTNPNFLFLNRGDGTFEDITEVSGAAYDAGGKATSSMGVDAEDADGDGRPELIVTNYQAEGVSYYRNLSENARDRAAEVSPAVFDDMSSLSGLSKNTVPWIGWGCALADFDNDGWPDFFLTNGHLDSNRNQISPRLLYEEPPLLFRNVASAVGSDRAGPRGFELSTRDVGPYFTTKHVGRGAAFGDLDNDGDIDIVVNHMDAPPAILRNDTPGVNSWIRLNLVGTRSNRNAIGTRVELEIAGRRITRQCKSGSSMQSTNDPRLLIGVGTVESIDRVTVHWPSGLVSTLVEPKFNTTHEVVETSYGSGAGVAGPRNR